MACRNLSKKKLRTPSTSGATLDHVLNLSPTDIVENILEVKNLIGVLQATVTFFFLESCKRMNVWTDIATENSIGPAS